MVAENTKVRCTILVNFCSFSWIACICDAELVVAILLSQKGLLEKSQTASRFLKWD